MNTKSRITNNSISIMGGVCFILFAFVCAFSADTKFSFLYDAITRSLGFIGFWLLLPYIIALGVYLILYKRIIKFKVGLRLWGVLLILFAFVILSSHWATIGSKINGVLIIGHGRTKEGLAQYLTFSNSIDVFNSISDKNPSLVAPNVKLGGGQIGYILAGAINSAITPLGLHIVCWSLFIVGVLMVFNTQVNRFIAFLKNRRTNKKLNVFKNGHPIVDEVEPTEPIQVESVQNEEAPFEENKPIFETFHTSNIIDNDNSLKKARFAFLDSTTSPTEVRNNDEISKATFDPTENPSQESYNEGEYKEPFFEPLSDQPEEIREDNAPFDIQKDKYEEEIPTPVPAPAPTPRVMPEPKPVETPRTNFIKNYIYPSIDLLEVTDTSNAGANEESCEESTQIINKTLENFHIGARVVSHTIGPSVTRFDLQMDDGVSVQSVQKYVKDISRNLNGASIRFEEIVAGKSTSGIEIPNKYRLNVGLREAIEGLEGGEKHRYDVPFGKNISGDLIYANFTDFPHLLVAGTTGSGKSIFVHATIVTLLMRNKPEELKLLMIDPKKVEMSYYDRIPHLLCPVISDMRKAKVAFDKLVVEMERRYDLFASTATRDMKSYNARAKDKGLEPLPYIIVFIDEYADLIETNKEVREPVVRLCQKARAAGIHLCLATQRPSVNVVDGVIKGNVATRVALMCASAVDSQTVIGEGGAEKLLGYGDMLVECPLISRAIKPRVQGCYVSDKEITRVCDFLREHYQPQYDPIFMDLEPKVEQKIMEDPEPMKFDKEKTDEEVYQRIKEDATHREFFSISYITRTYGMGFSRAGKMFTRLQREGVVAAGGGDARGCKVLMYNPISEEVSTVEQSTFIPDDGTNN